MKITNTSLNELDQDECLNNGVSSSSDGQTAVLSLVQDAECIAQVVLDLTFGSHPDLVFCCLFFSFFSYFSRSRTAIVFFVTLVGLNFLFRFFLGSLFFSWVLSVCDI